MSQGSDGSKSDSDLSGEITNSDSGRGGSEEELPGNAKLPHLMGK